MRDVLVEVGVHTHTNSIDICGVTLVTRIVVNSGVFFMSSLLTIIIIIIRNVGQQPCICHVCEYGTALASARPRSGIFNRTKCHASVFAFYHTHSKTLGPDPPPSYHPGTRFHSHTKQCYTFYENKRNYYYASNINRRLSSTASRWQCVSLLESNQLQTLHSGTVHTERQRPIQFRSLIEYYSRT